MLDNLPCDAEELADRDHPLGSMLRFVTEGGTRRLYLSPDLAVVWITTGGTRAERAEVLEEDAALDAWVAHGWRLPEGEARRHAGYHRWEALRRAGGG